jgi:glycyl-tRNA synthetase
MSEQPAAALTMQEAILALTAFWGDEGCLVVQPFNTEVGAGTMNPATILRVLGPEPWRAAYVEPSVRPDDSRYGENPNRLQTHTQYQVILKPEPGNPQELLLASLETLGIDLHAHDVRFVEDNWAQPAIGAWGLGWEVWLDGMEITQFTYFQQVGGLNLDPVAVEITYGLERILMASQGVTHFKDILYAPGMTYGEVFGQSEYEMSRYYLDDADVEANRLLFDTYTTEAQLMLERGLPVPAHTYVLKSSHAFNVMDARGAIGTTERANAFALMRRLARDVSRLWVQRREELGYPLLRPAEPAAAAPAPAEAPQRSARPETLLVEVGFEELPPDVVAATIDALRDGVAAGLAGRLGHGAVHAFGTPRRVAVLIEEVEAWGADLIRTVKGPKWAAAFDADGKPTKALEGFVRSKGRTVDDVVRVTEGDADQAAVEVTEKGLDVLDVVGEVVASVVSDLRSDRNMRWCDPELSFSRPIRWIVALWGDTVVPVAVSGLVAGRRTRVHRLATPPEVDIAGADSYCDTMAASGIVLSPAERRDRIVGGAGHLADGVGGTVDVEGESALLDEIAELVEEPVAILGHFEDRYLSLPEQVLTTVMRKHQRYLPVRDADGSLMAHFVAVANGPCDHAVVRAGNESVLRARYEDASFFWQADLATPPEQFHDLLERLTFEERVGSVKDRAGRIRDVATRLAAAAGLSGDDLATLARAGELAKFDLATQMVVELSSLAGFMAREYALRAGETPAVAGALAEMEQPRTSADAVPASPAGALLALADRADLLMAMFAVGAKVSGSSDPFGLRRAALGLVRILRDGSGVGELDVAACLRAAADRLAQQGIEVGDEALAEAVEFTVGRFAQLLREEGVEAAMVTAVLPGAGSPRRVAANLADLGRLADDEDFQALVAALERVVRIVPDGTPATWERDRLTVTAEMDLLELVEALPEPTGSVTEFAAAGRGLGAAVDAFFEAVLVNDPDEAVRASRLGLLAAVRAAAPEGLDWSELYLAARQRAGTVD